MDPNDAMASSDENADAWELRQDESTGHGYYYNRVTGDIVWEDGQTTSAWTEAYDESGAVYYVNMETSETTWEAPPGFISSSFAAERHEAPTAPSSPAKTSARRPSTAEQMKRLNALLSGDDDDDDDNTNGESLEGSNNNGAVEATEPLESVPAHDATATNWMMVINESDGVPYYYNYVTGECVWEPPAEYLAHLESQQEEATPHLPTDMLAAPEVDATQAVDLSDHVTPEVEDKVRRAIDSVSKTPVGSSRLLLVRTPTLRGSRPSSSSGSTARRPTSASLTQEAQPATEAPADSPVDVLQLEPEETAVEALVVEDAQGDLLRQEALLQELHVEESALVLQCIIRCFLARRRVSRRRKERQRQLQLEENEIAHSATSFEEMPFSVAAPVEGDADAHQEASQAEGETAASFEETPASVAAPVEGDADAHQEASQAEGETAASFEETPASVAAPRLTSATTEALVQELQKILTRDEQTRVDILGRERRRRIEKTLSTVRTSERRMQSHIEAIELALVEAGSNDGQSQATDRRRLQAQYLSRLRKRRNELLALVAVWEQRAQASTSGSVDDEYECRSQQRLLTIASDLGATTRQLLYCAGDTLLHGAAWKGCEPVVQFLIDELKVAVNVVDNTITRSTPLHEACRAGHEDVVQLLLSRGAALDAQDQAGDTPLHVSCRLGLIRIVQTLVAAGESLSVDDAGEDSEAIGACLAQTRSWVDCFNLCNGKRQRAMDLVTLPSLKESLQYYSQDLLARHSAHEPSGQATSARPEPSAATKKKPAKKKTKAKLHMRSDSMALAASLVLHA
ncbi:hypothetical protein P43SY_008141 [Pythium insidiosum]|uniref:WW domain-containing protein n=1 Tax=Pythium insidiosum TaxID=114742 RepID=A0AAD5M0E6_PYTIN|nr:hypothetical protein P43SY_008141 [Pythium insidiosum]